MKRKLIALGVASIFATPVAHALTPAQLTTLFSSDPTSLDQLWISGATAPTAAIRGAVTKLCLDADSNGTPDDLTIYRNNASGTARVSAYACTLASTGKPTLIYHTHNGGSFEAYTPHLTVAGEVNPFVPTTLLSMKDIAGGAATCTTTGAAAPYNYVGCGDNSPALAANATVNEYPTLPRGGFSDTEYVLNQINLGVALSLGDIGSEVPTNVGQVYGLAASYKLYYDMQVDQFGAGVCTTGFSAAAPNLTEACKPSVPAYKYMLVTNSGSVSSKDASLFNKNWPAAGTIPAASALGVERRVGTSGSQSSSAAYFLGAPCLTGQPGGALTAAGSNLAGSTVAGAVTVRSNSGSGDVSTNLDSTTAYRIGYLSLENNPGTRKWLWVKVDGVSPTDDAGANPLNVGKNRNTTLKGEWKIWDELVGFVPSSDTGEGSALVNSIIAAWSDPALTNLQGIFPTALSGATGPTVSEWFKAGVACTKPTR
jgi:hypothetical protein